MYDFFSFYAETKAAHSAIIENGNLTADDVFYISMAIKDFVDLVKDFNNVNKIPLEKAIEEHYS